LSARLQGLPNGSFDRRIIAVFSLEPERFGWVQRRLRHETWRGSPVHLRGVNEEGVAQIDRAGVAGGQSLGPVASDLVELQMRHPGLAGRREKARHVQMRARPYS